MPVNYDSTDDVCRARDRTENAANERWVAYARGPAVQLRCLSNGAKHAREECRAIPEDCGRGDATTGRTSFPFKEFRP